MTSPLIIAVAFTTEGIAEPKTCGFSGSFSVLVLFGAAAWADWSACCANAAVAVPRANAATVYQARAEIRSKPTATMRFSLLPNPIGECVYPGPLNAGLATKAFQSQMNPESAPLSERPDVLIGAAPRESKLQTFIFVSDAQA